MSHSGEYVDNRKAVFNRLWKDQPDWIEDSKSLLNTVPGARFWGLCDPGNYRSLFCFVLI